MGLCHTHAAWQHDQLETACTASWANKSGWRLRLLLVLLMLDHNPLIRMERLIRVLVARAHVMLQFPQVLAAQDRILVIDIFSSLHPKIGY